MCDHYFAISSVKIIGGKYYIVVHLELDRDYEGDQPNYAVYCLDLKQQTLNPIAKRLAHPIITEDRIIGWASFPGTYSGYFQSYTLGGTMQCQVRISKIWDSIVVSASKGNVYVNNYYNKSGSPIVFTKDGELISRQHLAVIEWEKVD